MTIELIKIQNDLFTGEVLYHNAIVKSEEEIAEMKKAREEKKRAKELRRKVQNENVEKKAKQKEEHKKRSMSGISKANAESNADEEEVVDNDADYYRDEVGEDPDEGTFFIDMSGDNNIHLILLLEFIIFHESLNVSDLFQSSITAGGKKRPFVPKHMKAKDAKRRKTDDNKGGDGKVKKFKTPKKDDDGDKGKQNSKKFKKTNDAPQKKVKKISKPKKTKGKKKSHRNKNK